MIESETIKITELVPAKYNPRKISNEEYKRLSQSIHEYGLVDPIIINLKNKHIIGGHQRYDILMEEYMNNNEDFQELTIIKRGDIGWAFPNHDLEVKDISHEKGLNIALNNQKLMGSWDSEKLEDLFNDIIIDGFDVTLTGFEKTEIKDLFKDMEFNGIEDDEPLTSSDEDPKKELSNSRTVKEITCPSCGHVFLEDEILDDDI